MRYSPALVLGTLAAGQAAAHTVRHASFHARRQNEAKRNPGQYDNVDWGKVSYDLSSVDWTSVFASQKSTPTPQVQENNYVQPAEETSAAPTPTATAAPAATYEPSQNDSNDSNNSNNDFSKGISSFFGNLGISVSNCNSQTENGAIWLGESSPWRVNFVNGGSDDLYVTCWSANQGGEYHGMLLATQPPLLAGYLAPGANQWVSVARDFPISCAPLKESTKLAFFGGVDNTWWEATFGPTGAFDVSRNVNMHGSDIHSKGSQCVSDMETCVFKCVNSDSTCKEGYNLFNCDAGNGGGGGYDAKEKGTGGGCSMGASGEKVTVTFS